MYSLFDLAKLLSVPEAYYTLFSVLVVILVVVVALLKGLALWRSARSNQAVWFWVFVFINTVGILEIIYLLTNKEAKSVKAAAPKVEEKKEEAPVAPEAPVAAPEAEMPKENNNPFSQ